MNTVAYAQGASMRPPPGRVRAAAALERPRAPAWGSARPDTDISPAVHSVSVFMQGSETPIFEHCDVRI